jgi:hypothetical protein
MSRRDFIDGETAARIALEYGPNTGADYGHGATPESDVKRPPTALFQSREYLCDCGFRCATAGAIFDHMGACGGAE